MRTFCIFHFTACGKHAWENPIIIFSSSRQKHKSDPCNEVIESFYPIMKRNRSRFIDLKHVSQIDLLGSATVSKSNAEIQSVFKKRIKYVTENA